MSPQPKVSFILATHNRRDVLANTLARIAECGLDRADFEIVVVDNASTDGAVEVAREHSDTVVELRENAGSCAKAFGVERARGEYIVFLDDDSFPQAGSVERMIDHFARTPNLGAAGFVVFLPDGLREGGALPDVFVGCGVGFRARALKQVGGLDATYFMQAEEYDLTFRLAMGGWDVRVFGELAVDHLKTPQTRRTDRTTYYDTRNNLRVIARYMPSTALRVCRADCLQRYAWLAEGDGHWDSYARGVRDGSRYAWLQRWHYRRWRLAPRVFERFFRWEAIHQEMRRLRGDGVDQIVLADLGKNIYPFVDGACRAGITVCAIGDDRFGAPERTYRGVPVVPLDKALNSTDVDRVVISNTAPVHATRTFIRLRQLTALLIEHWFTEPISQELHPKDSTSTTQLTDDKTGVDSGKSLIEAASASDRLNDSELVLGAR